MFAFMNQLGNRCLLRHEQEVLEEVQLSGVVQDLVADVIGGHEQTEPVGVIHPIEYKDGAFWWGKELLWENAL